MNQTSKDLPESNNRGRHRPPTRKRKTRWKYGVESAFKLLVFDGRRWLPPLYSHDVPNKGIAKGSRAEFSDAKKIERLQMLFARGGTRGNQFTAELVTYAAIVPNFGRLTEAVAFWLPQSGWRAVTKKTTPQAQNRDWRLWMGGEQSMTFVANTESDEFRQFAANLPVEKPHLAERYADPESGELPYGFLISAYLGEVATRLKAGGKKFTRAYIYQGQSPDPFLRVDLASGRLCGIKQGGAWVSPDIFFHQ